jgi:MFS family permease
LTAATPAGTSLASYGQLVRHNRDFRYLWFGQIVSLLGDWFNLIASASLIAELTRSGLAVGGLFVVRMLAPFLVSPIAGVAADRYNRKHLLIGADLSRALVVMGFLLVRRPEQVWLLYTLTAIQLAVSGFFFPARNAILPDIVSARELGAANALSSSTWSVMLALGAALGGLVAGQWGAYPSFVVDSLTFLASAFMIGHVAYRPTHILDGSDRSVAQALRQYVDGLRYLWRHTDVLFIALNKAAGALFISGAFQVVQVTLAEQVFVIGQGGGISLGLLYAVLGAGTGLGPIAARAITGDRDRPQRLAIATSYAIQAVGMALAAPLASFGLVLAGTFVRGFGGGVGWMFSTQLLLQLLPNRVRGRVFSTEFALFTLANAAGAVAGGWALDRAAMNLSGILWWMGGLILLPGLLWTLWVAFGKPSPGEAAPEALAEPAQD